MVHHLQAEYAQHIGLLILPQLRLILQEKIHHQNNPFCGILKWLYNAAMMVFMV